MFNKILVNSCKRIKALLVLIFDWSFFRFYCCSSTCLSSSATVTYFDPCPIEVKLKNYLKLKNYFSLCAIHMLMLAIASLVAFN